MKYVSIDIETTGLDPKHNDVLEFAAVYDDLRENVDVDKLPTYHAYVCREDDLYRGSAYALALNHKILSILAGRGKPGYAIHNYQTADSLLYSFYNWLDKVNYPDPTNSHMVGDDLYLCVTPAGKNFASFDKRFLEEQCEMPKQLRFSHRVFDPAPLYFRLGDDNMLPDSKECMRRADLGGEVAHTALEDAKMVVRLIRHKLKEGA